PAAGDQIARDDLEDLALAGHAGDGAETPAHAGGFDGLAHYGHVARRLERVVGPEASGHLHDPVDDVGASDHGVRRSLALGKLEALLGEVDADDALGALEPASCDRSQPDHASTEDDAGCPGLHLRGV